MAKSKRTPTKAESEEASKQSDPAQAHQRANQSVDQPVHNVVASINQRLLNLARDRRDEFQLVLTQYALERLLYRLGQSTYASDFIVKGAMLFTLWREQPHRVTRDLDLLGFGGSDLPHLKRVFQTLAQAPAPEDGLRFIEDSVRVRDIRAEQIYSGARVRLMALLGKARIPLQIDVGFGDAVTPEPSTVRFPTLLHTYDLPSPTVRVYPRETVISEKFEALVRLGIANTRMKDFYDLWILAGDFDFDGILLSEAIGATFARRGTPLPTAKPLAFTPAFHDDHLKQTQWQAFLRKSVPHAEALALANVSALLEVFLLPPTQALLRSERFNAAWSAADHWQEKSGR